MPIGVIILKASDGVVHVEERYDHLAKQKGRDTFVVNMSVPANMEPPVFFYYKLTGFYQNHRRYVKSRSDDQLNGKDTTDTADCIPLERIGDKIMYPCGLIANSYFSDVFNSVAPTVTSSNGANEPLDWTDKGIAWPSDVKEKFHQGPFHNETMTKYTTNDIEIDITGEDFIVWMRTAGLPNFMKLRYIINRKLTKGDVVSIQVHDTFNVSGFGGQKSLILSTTSWMGGKNEFLGLCYIVVASLCLILAILFFMKHLVASRPLGDMAYFNWAKTANS